MDVLPLPEPDRLRRIHLGDARDPTRGLRATWHLDDGILVLSTWRGSTCVGTVQLTATEAATLGVHLVDGLGELASAQRNSVWDRRSASSA